MPSYPCHPSSRLRVVVRTSVLLVWSLGLLAMLTSCNRGTAEGPQGPPVMPVKVQQIGSQEIGNTSEYVATIKSRNSATIMSDVEGWIFAISVKSGDMVKKGQTLMEIDPRRQAATVSNWESQRASKSGEFATGESPTRKSQRSVGVGSDQQAGT